MGLFSSETKTYVSTSVVRLIENKMLPNSVKTGSLKAIYEDGDMIEYVMEELIHNVSNSLYRAYRYAKAKSHIGVPSKQYINETTGTSAVTDILRAEFGEGTLEYYFFGVPSYYHFGWETLVGMGYDTKSNQFPNGYYLDYFSLEIDSATKDSLSDGVFQHKGISPYGVAKPWNPVADLIEGDDIPPVNLVDSPIPPSINILTGIQTDPELTPSQVDYQRIITPLPSFEDEDYFQACWIVDGKRHYWSYKKNSGKYPELDIIGKVNPGAGTYFPVIHFIANKKFIGDHPHTEDYKVNARLCKFFGLKMEDIWQNIRGNDQVENLNQASLMFALPANTDAEPEQRYAFDFFDNFVTLGNPSVGPVTDADQFFDRQLYVAGNSVAISDALFNMSLSFGGIVKQRKSGSVNPVGQYGSSTYTGTYNLNVRNPVTGIVSTVPRTALINSYTYQVTETLYDEIQVTDLQSSYRVFEQFYKYAKGNEDIVMLPLDKAILDTYPVIVREQVVARSMNFVFNSYQQVHIDFYEKGIFKNFLIVISIIFSIWTMGAGAGFTAALAAGGTIALTAIWSTLILPMLTVAMLGEVATFFVKAFGEDFAILVAVIAIAYGSYQSFSNASSLFADNLLKIGNALVNKVNESIQSDLGDIMQEIEDYQDYTKSMYEKLEQTSLELLGNTDMHLVSRIVMGEKPLNFFNRTIHSGNIGVKSIDATSNYVSLALKLPTIEDTLKGFNDE